MCKIKFNISAQVFDWKGSVTELQAHPGNEYFRGTIIKSMAMPAACPYPLWKMETKKDYVCLVLSCLVSLECTLGRAFSGACHSSLHCTVRSITPPWAGCSGRSTWTVSERCAALTHVLPVLDYNFWYVPISRISPFSLNMPQIPIILLQLNALPLSNY
jgi:hypothetical protein